ncbi:hypothetical protein E2C01_010913 [Portunus trituberculatus]|uniref:Uncharacterized protein n=1 Tax=Portunus trituberculatus TaxID=210409 RepID=A0A5B7D9R2_PORTR|nr:hypothetical protein [Portunus trituberculatus]
MRNSRSQQGNRPMSDISYIDEDSMKSPSPNSGKRCGSCNTAVRLVTPIEESSPTTAETAPLVPPGSPQGGPAAAATQQLGHHRPHTHANTQSTKCCHHHHHHLAGTAPSSPLFQPLSPHHFNTLISQTVHSNMAAHSSTLQPPSQSSPVVVVGGLQASLAPRRDSCYNRLRQYLTCTSLTTPASAVTSLAYARLSFLLVGLGHCSHRNRLDWLLDNSVRVDQRCRWGPRPPEWECDVQLLGVGSRTSPLI